MDQEELQIRRFKGSRYLALCDSEGRAIGRQLELTISQSYEDSPSPELCFVTVRFLVLTDNIQPEKSTV